MIHIMRDTEMTIEQSKPWFSGNETEVVAGYLTPGSWLTEYTKTHELENIIADYLGVRHCIAVPNGTLALYAALVCLGIGRGDKVLVPDLTMIATANAVRMVGAEPVFVDIERETLCFDTNSVKDFNKVKAAIVVSLNGRAPDMKYIQRWTQDHGILLIEDACQAFGSCWAGQYLGTFGICGAFSFSPHKIITTGQGGCIVTNDDGLAHTIRLFKDFGRVCGGVDDYQVFGINLKFTDLQAVIGIEQMRSIDWRIVRKKQIFDLYRNSLSGLPKINFVETNLKETVPWFVDILVEDREGLREFLRQKDIQTRPMYPPIRRTAVYGIEAEGGWISDYVSRQGLWLPSFLGLSDDQINEVCSAIVEYHRR